MEQLVVWAATGLVLAGEAFEEGTLRQPEQIRRVAQLARATARIGALLEAA